MKRVTRNGLIIAAAASGAVAVTMPVYADSAAGGATGDSPGLISGNTIQLPVHVPVNVCGNTVNAAGLLNPAAGNGCANAGGGTTGDTGRGDAKHLSGAVADGSGKDSPGVLSGNGVRLPVQLPVNVTGNSVNVVGIGNAAAGNESTNTPGERPHPPAGPAVPKPSPPPRKPATPQPPEPPRPVAPPQPGDSLAHTGMDLTGPTVAASAALMLGGAVLYRRFRAPSPQLPGRAQPSHSAGR
ncbi:chaplin [Streptomyces sp. NPDC050704]|uniref:chaplin n=1 Tax=Streptomyces sp. NPDC050704 TaxID=3157219 RepID=UPI00343A600F